MNPPVDTLPGWDGADLRSHQPHQSPWLKPLVVAGVRGCRTWLPYGCDVECAVTALTALVGRESPRSATASAHSAPCTHTQRRQRTPGGASTHPTAPARDCHLPTPEHGPTTAVSDNSIARLGLSLTHGLRGLIAHRRPRKPPLPGGRRLKHNAPGARGEKSTAPGDLVTPDQNAAACSMMLTITRSPMARARSSRSNVG
ncbi:hypothetical protein LAUMK4_00995 [Mycobacterium persicum]|uniref:Uncharacterized protein n=1 Tax=Mycobacterium persicum TaxID=1487726 RepID=A0AB38UP32_9MYCO|nr:hypothetical protein LAUMK15_01350 [Mycobacterium persicum]VAZ82403.1 hypothetical protein LAUMK42_01210 [Mycobacterium persicum]VAZ89292.1 hypothetical protein LAUMK4_00995 [Mycobacterium persicum]